MATYKEIVGTAVTNIAGDSPTTVDGDIWYNSSATNFKFNVIILPQKIIIYFIIIINNL